MKDPLFPELPEDISDGKMSDEELTESLAAHREIAKKIHGRDAELLEGRDAADVIAEFESGVEAIARIEKEIADRAEAEAETASHIDELAAKAGVLADSDEGSDDDDGAEAVEPEAEVVAEAETTDEPAAEPEAEPEVAEPEPVVAAAPPQRSVRRARLPIAREEREVPPEEDGVKRAALTASSGLDGIMPGQTLDEESAVMAIVSALERRGTAPSGFRDEVVVASARFDYPDEFILTGDAASDGRKVLDVAGPRAKGVNLNGEEAIVAAGGLCARFPAIYDLGVWATAQRPVRDALVGFQATRGGIAIPTQLSLSDATQAVGVVEASADEAGGASATKSCFTLQCDPYSEFAIGAVYACVQWGNFGARTWPERVSAFMELVDAAHARVAETRLLDLIDDESTQVTAAQATYGYGAVSSLLNQILVARDGMISRHRMDPARRLRAILPFWLQGLLVGDLRNSNFDKFAYNVGGVEALLREHGIDPTWHLDTSTGDGQIFGAQGAGALLTYPNDVKWWLFPEGSFLFLDQGTLDLGIVRDSTLNETNDYQIFMETFEGVAYQGIESQAITSTLCNNGEYAPAGSALTCA